MRPLSYYDTPTIPHPDQDDFTTIYVYSRGRVLWQGTPSAWKAVRNEFAGVSYVHERVLNAEAFQAARNAWHAEKRRLNEEFEADLYAEHGVAEGNRKAKRCFELASRRSNSKAEIADAFAELVELITD